MRLLLLRHGPAEARDERRWPEDSRRPLTERGALRVKHCARGVTRLERRVDLILSSPLERAWRTAELLREAFDGGAKLESITALEPSRSVRALLQRVAEESPDATVVLVGHEPDLGKLAGTLLFGAPAAMPLKKAGACCISFDGVPASGAGTLRWFLPPRALQRLARRRNGS